MRQFSAIVDIGSSKIICLICSPDGKDNIVVHGAGVREYSGYRHGVFADEQQFADAVVDALSMAEHEAKHSVGVISVGVPAPFLKLALTEGKAEVAARSKRVSYDDIEALMNDSMKEGMPAGYELIHSTPVEFMADDAPRQDMPLGVTAKTITAKVSHVLAEAHFKRLVADALAREGLEPDMYIGVPLSEALFVIPEPDRQYGGVLIDVGAAHTDVSLVKNNAIVALRTIDVGGCHFTGDLSYGLGMQQSVAENIKRRYVYSLDYQDSIDVVRIPGGGTLNVEHGVIQLIIEARSRELCDLISAALGEMGVELTPKLPVYLTGGGVSLMRGSCEYMERRMGVPIQVRMPWMPRLSSPNYASAFSVMDFVMHAGEDDNGGRLEGFERGGRLLRKIRDFFIK